ncbi:hypothetical protein N7478_000179 [Penicillium angulare]|uniref:uncharacterized protein n=1 Tax=Penicillium angulare TaxID=116970 RepID=UPI002540A0CF|nr:uncharacterized protein N7478_000179 [Penicillium angulare]KAJ5290928.1 hypothetical protein N7478_000179 [Penicillium angulare]
MEVHVVSKQDISQHASFSLPASATLGELGPSSVRIRPQIVSLGANNLSYAMLGTALKWWDLYPVQENYPAPYNDNSKWGIAPAWGFSTVVESTIPEIAPETLLYGIWPTTAVLTDMQLEKTTPQGHWIETSPHRQTLMSLYNHYVESPRSNPVCSLSSLSNYPSAVSPEEALSQLAWSSVFRTLWTCGYYLSEHVFQVHPDIKTPVHPLGNQFQLPWSESDADLSSAVVVSLGGSTKTARTFAYFLERKEKTVAPLGFLQVTSASVALSEATKAANPSFPSKAIEYADIESDETVEWLRQLNPSKIIVLEIGVRGDGLDRLLDSIKQNTALQFANVVIIKIGSPTKALSAEELIAAGQEIEQLGKVRCNTSGMQDTAIEAMGAETFFNSMDVKWEKLYHDRKLWAPDLKIRWSHGISGSDGIESGWTKICHGEVLANEASVYQLQETPPYA